MNWFRNVNICVSNAIYVFKNLMCIFFNFYVCLTSRELLYHSCILLKNLRLFEFQCFTFNTSPDFSLKFTRVGLRRCSMTESMLSIHEAPGLLPNTKSNFKVIKFWSLLYIVLKIHTERTIKLQVWPCVRVSYSI